MPDRSRPPSVVVVSLALFALSAFSAVAGLGMTMVSNCCGSSDPSNGTFALVGFLVAGIVVVAGIGLWRGAMSLRALVGATLAVPAVCAVASLGSSDFAGALLPAVLGWLWFWWFLRRPRPNAWLSRTSRSPRGITT